MTKIRINNEINLSWTVYRLSSAGKFPEDFTGADIVDMYIFDKSGKFRYSPVYSIIGGTFRMSFPASRQKQLGEYNLYLQYIKDGNTHTVDSCKAFELVSESCKQSLGDGYDGVTVDTVSLDTQVDLLPSEIMDGVSSYDDLSDKPKINGIEIIGEVSLESLGITIEGIGVDKFVEEKIADHNADKEAHSDIRQSIIDYLIQSKGYTDQQIADLIGTAPEMLDTIHELAEAIQQGGTTIDALNDAIVTKLGKEEAKGLYVAMDGYIAYTQEEKDRLTDMSNYDDTQIRNDINSKVDKETGKVLSTNDYTTAEKRRLATVTQPTFFTWSGDSYQVILTPPDFNDDIYQIIACSFLQTNPIDNPTAKIGGRVYTLKINDQQPLKERISPEEICFVWFFKEEARMFGLDSNRATIGQAMSGNDKNRYITPETLKAVTDAANDLTHIDIVSKILDHNSLASAHPLLYEKLKAYVDASVKDLSPMPIYFSPMGLSFTRPVGAGSELTIAADTTERVFFDHSIVIGRDGQVNPNNLYYMKLFFRSVSSSRITYMRIQYFVKGVELINEVNAFNNSIADFKFADLLPMNKLQDALDYLPTDELRIVLSFWVNTGTDNLYLKLGSEAETSELIRLEPISTGVTKSYVDDAVLAANPSSTKVIRPNGETQEVFNYKIMEEIERIKEMVNMGY